MANIESMVDVTLALHRAQVATDYCLHVCVYHSQHPLIVRSSIERTLDAVLNRTDPVAVFSNPHVLQALASDGAKHHVFIVLGSPVVEVGRDHDYDWAILEPSSMRSIIQSVGRVRRHRSSTPTRVVNVVLLDKNVNTLLNRPLPYSKPGYETETHSLKSHTLQHLLPAYVLNKGVLDASPRIQESQVLDSQRQLADLEHACTRAMMHVPVLQTPLQAPARTRVRRSAPSGQTALNAASWLGNDAQEHNQLHSILLRAVVPSVEDQHFVIANLIRGNVAGASGKE